MFYTYIYRDKDGVPFYVGKGHGARAYAHLTRKDDSHLARKIRKMRSSGFSPEIEIIPAIDESHAFFMEECCIFIIGRRDLGKGPLLNLTDGGDGVTGYRWTDAQKIAHSKAHKGQAPWNKGVSPSLSVREKMSASSKQRSPESRIHKEETKQKISSALTGKVRTAEHSKAISEAKKGKPGKKNSPETIAKRTASLLEYHRLKKEGAK